MQLRRTMIGLLALLGALAMPLPAQAEPGITTVGTLERFPQEAVEAFGPEFTDTTTNLTRTYGGTLLAVPGAGQAWQVYPQRLAQPRTGVLVRDAGTRRVIGSFFVEARLRRAGTSPSGGGEWLHATDGGRRVFLVSDARRLLEVDAATFAVTDRGPLAAVGPGLSNADPLFVAGLAYDRSTDDLLVLYGGLSPLTDTNRLTMLQRIDLATGERQARVVRSCTGPLPATHFGGTYAAELVVGDDAVHLTCQKQLRGLFGASLLEDDARALVVRLPRETLWQADGPESGVDAGRRFNSALVDPAGGRIAVADLVGRVSVVDLPTMRVVGVFDITAADNTLDFGFGLDRASGRFYFQSDRGFGYVDIRPTPLPATAFDPSAAAAGEERIVPHGNRAYVLPGRANMKPARYTIYNVAP